MFDSSKLSFFLRPSESIASSIINAIIPTTISTSSTPIPTPTPSYTPSFIPSPTPSFAPSYTPSYIPSYTPSYTPTYTPSYIPTSTSSCMPSYLPSIETEIGTRIVEKVVDIVTGGGPIGGIKLPMPDFKRSSPDRTNDNIKIVSTSSSSSSSSDTYSSSSSSKLQSKSTSNLDDDKSESAGVTDNEIIFENNTDYDLEFECEDSNISKGSISVDAKDTKSVLIYTKFRLFGLHPKFTMRVFRSGSLLLEEKNFTPTPNKVNHVFDDKITGRPLKRKDNPFSIHLEPDRIVKKFKIPISEAVKNFEDKQRKTKSKEKIDNIREQLAILQQKLDKLLNLDIPANLENQYDKIVEKITKALEISDKNDKTLSELSAERINDIKDMIKQAQNFIDKVEHVNKKDKAAETAKPIRSDLERLAKILQEIESQSGLLKITPELQKTILSVSLEAKGVLSFKNKGDSQLTESFGMKVDKVIEKANAVLEEIKRIKQIFREKQREQKRIDVIRENLQTLATLLDKSEFKNHSPAGISQGLLKEKSRVLDIALKAMANKSQPDHQLDSSVGEAVQQAINSANQFSTRWNLELNSLKERQRLHLAEKERQMNELKTSLSELKVSLQESKLLPQIKFIFLNRLAEFNAQQRLPITQSGSQDFLERGQKLCEEIRNEIKLSQSKKSNLDGHSLFIPYSSREDVRSPTGSDKHDFDDRDEQVVIVASRPSGF